MEESRDRRTAQRQTFFPFGRDVYSRRNSRGGDRGLDNPSTDEEDDYWHPPRLARPRSNRASQSRRYIQSDYDDQEQSSEEYEELLPVSVTARNVDPSKLIRSYEGRTDHRTLVGFIREFEQYTSNIQDKIRGKIFVRRLNTTKFRMTRSYKHSLGYQALKEQFLASEWGETAREEAIRRIDAMRYNPAKFASWAEFLVAIYEQLYDCRISIRSLFNKIMRHCPFYFGEINEKDCRFFDNFAAKVQDLQARFGDHVNDPNLGFFFGTLTPRTSGMKALGTSGGVKPGAFMIPSQPFEEDDSQTPYIMQIGGVQSTQQNIGHQSYVDLGNELWH